MLSTLQIQTILYRNTRADVFRFIESMAAAIRSGQDSGRISGGVALRVGDCSPTPCLTDSDLSTMRDHLVGRARLEYHFFDENLMTARGHNTLASLRGDEEVLIVVNPDTYASPNLLTRLLEALDDPRVGEAEARQVPLEHPKAFDQKTGDTSWSSTCCVALRVSAFAEVNGFDAVHFPLYCDDVDFSWRLRSAGYRVVYVPGAVIFHDKKILASGGVEYSALEQRSGASARLMLCRRYGRPDLETETITWVEAHGNDSLRAAVREFKERVVAGTVPELIGDPTVANFIDGAYAPHRF